MLHYPLIVITILEEILTILKPEIEAGQLFSLKIMQIRRLLAHNR